MAEMDATARQIRDTLAEVMNVLPSDIEAMMLNAIEHPGRTMHLAIRTGDELTVKFGRRRRLQPGKYWTITMYTVKR